MNEKLAKIKRRATNAIKDHAPELLTLGASAAALVAYAAYVMNSDKTSTDQTDRPRGLRALILDDSIEIIDMGEQGHMVVTPETYAQLKEDPSKIEFDLDEDHRLSFTRINIMDV